MDKFAPTSGFAGVFTQPGPIPDIARGEVHLCLNSGVGASATNEVYQNPGLFVRGIIVGAQSTFPKSFSMASAAAQADHWHRVMEQRGRPGLNSLGDSIDFNGLNMTALDYTRPNQKSVDVLPATPVQASR